MLTVRFHASVSAAARATARRSAASSAGTAAGFTLLELLLTIAVIGILAAALIPQLTSDLPERLTYGAQVVASDLDYARALAVANNSKYRVSFDTSNNRYYLKHSGTDTTLNTLPASPFRQTTDASDTQTTDLAKLPLPEPHVQLAVVVRMQSNGQSTTEVEFTPQGGTTAAYQTVVWLTCGSGSNQRYISVTVNPTTGLTEIGPLAGALPSNIASLVAGGS